MTTIPIPYDECPKCAGRLIDRGVRSESTPRLRTYVLYECRNPECNFRYEEDQVGGCCCAAKDADTGWRSDMGTDRRTSTRVRELLSQAWRLIEGCFVIFVIVLLMHVVTAITLAAWWATGAVEVSRPAEESALPPREEDR